MLPNVLNRNLPSTDGVALLAIRSQLPLVNVGMAILATLSNVGEDHPNVTLRAAYRLMHAAQRISRLVVIEFRNATDRFPCGRCVAVLARNAQVAVWATRS
jgi:RNase P subunit RPR2